MNNFVQFLAGHMNNHTHLINKRSHEQLFVFNYQIICFPPQRMIQRHFSDSYGYGIISMSFFRKQILTIKDRISGEILAKCKL